MFLWLSTRDRDGVITIKFTTDYELELAYRRTCTSFVSITITTKSEYYFEGTPSMRPEIDSRGRSVLLLVLVVLFAVGQAAPVVTASSVSFANGQQAGDGTSANGDSDGEIYYQVDFVEGDVISQLGPADSDNFYSEQDRLLQYLIVGANGDVTQSSNREAADVETDPDCVLDGDEDPSTITFTPANQTARLTFEINGSDSCTGEFELALVGYCLPEGETKFNRSNADRQVLTDFERGNFSSGDGTVTLTIELADCDGDGIANREEGTGDADGDGTPNYLDDDSDGDGIPDSEEGTDDTDGDDDSDDSNEETDDGTDTDDVSSDTDGDSTDDSTREDTDTAGTDDEGSDTDDASDASDGVGDGEISSDSGSDTSDDGSSTSDDGTPADVSGGNNEELSNEGVGDEDGGEIADDAESGDDTTLNLLNLAGGEAGALFALVVLLLALAVLFAVLTAARRYFG